MAASITSPPPPVPGLDDAEARYRLMVENVSDVVYVTDTRRRIVWVSPTVTGALGWAPADLIGQVMADYVHPDDRAATEGVRTRLYDGGRALRDWLTLRIRTKDGGYRWMSGFGTPLLGADGIAQGVVAGLRDVDDLVRARDEAERSEQMYRLLAENASDVVLMIDPGGEITWASESVTRVLRWRPEQLLGRGLDVIHPDDRARALAGRAEVIAGSSVSGEARIECADGSYRWMAITVRPVPGPDGVARVVGMRDIQDEVETRLRLEQALGRDVLTGLDSRATVLRRLEETLESTRPTRAVAVLSVGIDGLTGVNEALTYAGGDRVVVAVASRLATVTRTSALLGRGSGDEFLVVVPDLADGAAAATVAEQLRGAAQGVVEVSGHRVEPTVSVGVATGRRGTDAEHLVRDASLAMHHAKARGRDRVEYFDPILASEAKGRLALVTDIHAGLRDGRFVPWLQPIVTLADGNLVGYEALVRWIHPDGTVAAPDRFMPTAERSTLVSELDRAVLLRTVDILRTLPDHIHVAVNVSAATLARADYASLVLDCLDADVEARRLHLEVTETALLAFPTDATVVMRALADAGIRWYVDDFGTGYSSISHLRDLPIAGLKLDQSFTAGIRAGDVTSTQLAQALIGLADGLALDTVAEGVETAVEAEVLTAQGWRHGQGWLYGRPAPPPGSEGR